MKYFPNNWLTIYMVSILVLCHAYGIFTNIRYLHHAIYDFWLCKSFDH